MTNRNGLVDDRLNSLYSRCRRKKVVKLGLERIERALNSLFLRHQLPPIILIGGTNGKGTTAGFLWRLISQTGLRSGLYTSPHIVSLSERVQCSHRTIDNCDLSQSLHRIESQIDNSLYNELSFFEVVTLMALEIFVREECRVIVLEVGLGGRLDATNVIDPIISVITSIDYDHTEWLGNSLAEIATEKLGIARENKPLFIGDGLLESKKSSFSIPIEVLIEKTNSIAKIIGNDFGMYKEGSYYLRSTDGNLQKYILPLNLKEYPRVLKSNFVLAVAVANCFFELRYQNHRKRLYPEKFFDGRGIFPYSLLGRYQKIKVQDSGGFKHLVLDVCHNPASLKEFIYSLECDGLVITGLKKIPAAFTVMQDKNINKMIELLAEVFDPIMIFKVDDERCWSYSSLSSVISKVEPYEDFSTLWKCRASKFSGPLAVCGSFSAVGTVFEFFNLQSQEIVSHPPVRGNFIYNIPRGSG